MSKPIVFAMALAAFLAGPAAAQDTAGDQAADSQQIVVIGDVAPGDLPTQIRPGPVQSTESRLLGADSAFFVRCAHLPKRPRDLRAIVDRNPRDTLAAKALHRLIIRNIGCFQGVAPFLPPPPSPYYGECNPQAGGTCRNIYDRGALYERVLAEYAPGFELSRLLTFDRTIRDRFVAREEARNHLRLTGDLYFFDTVSCFVQVSPEYAQALVRSPRGSAVESTARQYLVGHGSPCVGGAKTVKVDAGQLRAYTAEAVYEWIVAAKGAASLVP